MKMNYSEWFYRQHRYLIGDDKTYNDTKWVNINDRYQGLIACHRYWRINRMVS